jgi:hypothetical protein
MTPESKRYLNAAKQLPNYAITRRDALACKHIDALVAARDLAEYNAQAHTQAAKELRTSEGRVTHCRKDNCECSECWAQRFGI